MAYSLLRTDKEIVELYERRIDMVYRICLAYMKNVADAEDIVQETFIQLIKTNIIFQNPEHEKAWLIRTSVNLCKNSLRHWWRKREALEDHQNLQDNSDMKIDETFRVVLTLPDKLKTVILLYYYEGYDSVEISEILRKPQSTIRYYLQEARKILKIKLGGDFDGE